jgi:branched-chain amino acid transport system permease protein
MLGAYIGATLVPRLLEVYFSGFSFWAGILLSALIVGLIGVLLEVLLLRRIYKAPELFQLLATFGVVLVIQDLVVQVFGPQDILGPRAPGLRQPVEILGRRFPSYELVLIAAGPLVLGLSGCSCARRASAFSCAQRRRIARWWRRWASTRRCCLPAPCSSAPFSQASAARCRSRRCRRMPGMDLSIIAEAFVVTVVGGMGSVTGAFLAALIIGQLQAFGILIFPKITLVVVFLLMAVVLVIRPNGLFGKPETLHGGHTVGIGSRAARGGRAETVIALAVVAVLALLPLVGDAYMLKVGIEILVFALFAFSLHLLIGVGGIVSFGHAAYFGLGAYGAALAVKWLGAPMEAALPLAPLFAGLGAALFGAFVVQLSGIYLAMLTLAAAQILFAVAFQWVEVTGGDNGIVGVWPSAWASSRSAYYLLTLALVALAVLALRRVIEAPFGYALRAMRDSQVRADAIGIEIRRHRWLAFTLAGAAAGSRRALRVLPRLGRSDGARHSDLGRCPHHAAPRRHPDRDGPARGRRGAAYAPRSDHAAHRTLAHALGLSIIAMVLLFPRGLVGTVQRWREGEP